MRNTVHDARRVRFSCMAGVAGGILTKMRTRVEITMTIFRYCLHQERRKSAFGDSAEEWSILELQKTTDANAI